MQNNPSSNDRQNEAESLSPDELLHRHLKDPNHQVTDEELRNLKVGADAEDENEVSKAADKIKEEIQQDGNNDSLPNPYTVVG